MSGINSFNKKSELDLFEVESNIYGSTATGMLGGGLMNITKSYIGGSKTYNNKSISTGGATSSGYELVAYPEYIKNQDFQTFMQSFYLIRKISHTPSAGVYVIPNKKELNDMIKDFHSKLAKENIEVGTEEALKFAAIKELPYKKCIFTVFGGDEQHYKLDKEPAYRNFGTVKRVNLLSEVLYFKYESETEIKICPTSDCSNGTTVKLIAKCNNGVYVFQGNIPEAKETKARNSAKVISSKCDKNDNAPEETLEDFSGNLEGGYKKLTKKNAQSTKMILMAENVSDEDTARNFIANMALADYEKNGNATIAKYSNMFSGDLLHTAFRIVFNDECNYAFDTDYDDSDKDEIIKELVSNYKINNKVQDRIKFAGKFKSAYKKVLNSNFSNPAQSSKEYKKIINNMFSKLGKDMLKADIATSMFRNGQNITESIKFANSIDSDKEIMENNLSRIEYDKESGSMLQTSRYNYIINKALTTEPLIGINAKTYAPILSYKPKRRRVYKRSMKGGDLYDSDEEPQKIPTEDKKEKDSSEELDIDTIVNGPEENFAEWI